MALASQPMSEVGQALENGGLKGNVTAANPRDAAAGPGGGGIEVEGTVRMGTLLPQEGRTPHGRLGEALLEGLEMVEVLGRHDSADNTQSGQSLFGLSRWLDWRNGHQFVALTLADGRHPGADVQVEVGLRLFGHPEIIGKVPQPLQSIPLCQSAVGPFRNSTGTGCGGLAASQARHPAFDILGPRFNAWSAAPARRGWESSCPVVCVAERQPIQPDRKPIALASNGQQRQLHGSEAPMASSMLI